MVSISYPEKKVLFVEKVNEGKTYLEANNEISRDVNFERFLSKNNISILRLKKTIENKNKQIELFKERIKKIKSTKIKEKMKYDMNNLSRDTGNLATTKDLWRIIVYLEDNGKTKLEELSRACVFSTTLKRKIRDNAISFLMKIKLINQERVGNNVFLWRC